MKKILLICAAALTLSTSVFATAYETTVNRKISGAFDYAFSGANDVKWYTDDNKTFTAKFTMNHTKVNAYFDADGQLLVTSRYITGESLPFNVVNRLIKKYPDNKIQSVVEYTSAGGTVYLIMLEGEKTWTKVKSDETGTLTLMERLIKA
ncbi:hypothetical protein [Chitinophaga sp. Cy-1792]|uniref:hypothetical protein n=1 Tax=Chitinophaga sp. Cy-1792 TaxID=2608339 RepID=UPI0014245862|nr:hypothetical protein [Chitinophaga sp. Cy-1792]NIG52665.1 hypothetical protein [Chitinophaga sp. Cy-1792]